MVSTTDDRDLRRGARLIVAAFAVRPLLCRFLGRRHDDVIHGAVAAGVLEAPRHEIPRWQARNFAGNQVLARGS